MEGSGKRKEIAYVNIYCTSCHKRLFSAAWDTPFFVARTETGRSAGRIKKPSHIIKQFLCIFKTELYLDCSFGEGQTVASRGGF